MRTKIFILNILIFSCVWECTSKTTETGAKSNAQIGGTQNGLTSTSTSSKGTTNSGTGTDLGGSGSPTDTSSEVSGSAEGLDANALNNMSLDDLQSYYTSRTAEVVSDQAQIGIDATITNSLCARLQKLRNDCVTANTLVALPGGVDPSCASITQASTTPSPSFTVTLTDASGNPFKADGQYILVANNIYQSTPFGTGPTNITFTYKGGGNVGYDEIMQVNNFDIRRAADTVGSNYISGGSAVAMPAITSLQVQLKYNGQPLASGPLIAETNASFVKYRFLLSLSTVSSNATSSLCTVQQAEIDNIKLAATNAQQAKSNQTAVNNIFSKTANTTLPSKDQMISAILAAQTQISSVQPTLDANMTQITAITTKLQTNQAISCHSSETIVQLSIAISGKLNDPKQLTPTATGTCPVIPGVGGQGSILSLDMGPNVTVNIDTSKQGIGGAAIVVPVTDQALVGNIEYVRLGKLGVTIDDLGPKCVSGPLGVNSSCVRQCQEGDTFTITGVKILLDTPSITGFTIYDNQTLNLVLGSILYSSSAVMSWNDPGFRSASNPHWNALMLDNQCGQQQ